MLHKIRRNFCSAYWQYIWYFTAIVTVIVVAMGAYLYQYYFNTMRSEFITANQNYLNTVITKHENDLDLINNTAVQFGISDFITPFMLEEQAVKSLPVLKQIKSYQMISQFYSQLYLVFEKDDYLYSSSSSIHMDRFLNQYFILAEDSPHVMYSLLRRPGKIGVLREQGISGTVTRKGAATLYFVPLQPGNTGTLMFVVEDTYFNQVLGSASEDMRRTCILKDGTVIAARGEAPLSDATLLELLAKHENKEVFEEKLDGKSYWFTVKTAASGFVYCTLQSASIFRVKVFDGQWGILAFILLLLIPIAVLVGLFSERLHKPVRIIRASLSNKEGSNDFDAIRVGIQELSDLVQESTTIRRSEVIRNFVRQAFNSREAILTESRKVGLDFDKKYFAVVLTGSGHNYDDKPALEILIKLLGPDQAVTGYGADLISQNQSLLILFSDSVAEMEQCILYINETGKRYCERFVMAVSALHEDFNEISTAYLEANTAFDNRFIMGDNELLRFLDIGGIQEHERCPVIYIDELKNALRFEDEQRVISAIDGIFRYLRSKKFSLFAFRMLYNDIIHVLLNEWNPNEIEMHRIYDIFTLSRCLSIQDLDDMLRSICKQLLSSRKTDDKSTHENMHTAADYMKEHYSDVNLNMNVLAEHLNISAVELSVKFKELMDISPSDYLTLLRIGRAKELLVDTDLSLKEVCGAVGYYDVPGFVRRFKKYTGQTPVQFRQNHRMKG